VGIISEPPEQVFCVGYQWTEGNASGGKSELFSSKAELESRINELINKNEIQNERLYVFELFEGQWRSVMFDWPRGFQLVGLDG
jgi:hypothetical protein